MIRFSFRPMHFIIFKIFIFCFVSSSFAAEVDLPHPDDWKNEIYNMKREFEFLEKELGELLASSVWEGYREVCKIVIKKEEDYVLKFHECYHVVIANPSSENRASFLEAYNLFLSLCELVSDTKPSLVGFILCTQKRLFPFPDPGLIHTNAYQLKEWYEHCLSYLKLLKDSLELQLPPLSDELL